MNVFAMRKRWQTKEESMARCGYRWSLNGWLGQWRWMQERLYSYTHCENCNRRRSLYCQEEIPQHPLLGPPTGQDAFRNTKYLLVLVFETSTAAFQSLYRLSYRISRYLLTKRPARKGLLSAPISLHDVLYQPIPPNLNFQSWQLQSTH